MTTIAFQSGRIFDGESWHEDAALLVQDGLVQAIVACGKIPAGADLVAAGDMLAPGFVDLQVNGGGGVMLNDHPDVDDVRTALSLRSDMPLDAAMRALVAA